MNRSKNFSKISETTSIYLDSAERIESKLIFGEKIMCSFLNISANTFIPMHTHEEEQILIILEGSIEHTIGDETKVLGPGDVAVQPSMVPHGGITGKNGLKGIDIFSPVRSDFLELLKKQRDSN